MKKISVLKSAIEALGIRISLDQIRKLTKAGIVIPTVINKHRWFTDEQFSKSLKNIILYYFNTPIEDIKKDSPEVIKDRVIKIKRALKLLT